MMSNYLSKVVLGEAKESEWRSIVADLTLQVARSYSYINRLENELIKVRREREEGMEEPE